MAAVVLVACSAPAPPPVSNQSHGAEVAIVLERTPCLGTCPVYRVALFGDGRVEWLGEAHVAARGRRYRKVDPVQVARLLDDAVRAQFFDRNEDGELPVAPRCTRGRCDFPVIVICSDLSRAVIEIARGARRHRVTNEHCRPSPLDSLEAQIDAVAGTSLWVGGR